MPGLFKGFYRSSRRYYFSNPLYLNPEQQNRVQSNLSNLLAIRMIRIRERRSILLWPFQKTFQDGFTLSVSRIGESRSSSRARLKLFTTGLDGARGGRGGKSMNARHLLSSSPPPPPPSRDDRGRRIHRGARSKIRREATPSDDVPLEIRFTKFHRK